MSLDYKINNELLENQLETLTQTKNVVTNISDLEEGLRSKKIFNGYCKKAFANGDIIVDYDGTDCYLPIANFTTIDASIVRHIAQNKVGRNISFRVESITNDEIIIERKSVIKEIRDKYSKLQVGNNIYGIVTAVDQNKGAFVDIGGDITGIIPKSMIENVFVSNVSDHIEVDEKVYAKVIELNRDDNGEIIHLALNRKILLPSFEELTKDISTYDVVVAKVKQVNKNGIHCFLNQHLDIFCGFAPGINVKNGDMVRVVVKQIRADRQRINGNILGKL